MPVMRKTTLLFLFSSFLLLADAQKKKAETTPYSIPVTGIIKNLSDSALLDVVQKQTFRYFWNFAHPVSGMARERSNEAFEYGNEVVTTGGTGFGIMAVIAAANRGWIGRDTAARHLLKMVKFLWKAN